MDPTGPDGAPRDDGLDVRWGSDWQYIVSLYPDTKPYLWGLAAAIYDQALRAERDILNPFWRDDPGTRAERASIPADSGDAIGASTRLGPEPTLRNAPRVSPLEGEPMPNLVQIPPAIRTWIYYLLGVLNAANVAAFLVLGSDNKWLLAGQVFLGALSGLFFGVAASNVRAEPSQSLVVERTETPDPYDPKHD